MNCFDRFRRACLTGLAHLALAAPLSVFLALLLPQPARAQAPAFPSRPISLIVPFPAGGPNDILARAVAEPLSARLKQPVIIENKPGATGNIGAQFVTKAPADGHTLLLTLDTSITANPTLYGQRMGFDAQRDLRPVATLARFSQMLVVNPGARLANFKQFTEAAAKGLNYASAGNASPGHLTMESLQSLIGGKLYHAAYRGNAPAVVDILGGQVQAGFVATPSVAQHVASGKLIALAVSGSKRSPLAPEVPTLAQLGYPAGTTEFGYVLMAPAATPDAVIQQLGREVQAIMTSPAIVDKLKALDIEPVVGNPQQAANDLAAGRTRWSRIIKERGIQPD